MAVTTTIPTGQLLLGVATIMILFGVFFYRHARALWVGILLLAGTINEDV
jgi:hypothetical protein